jgi:hypothetical protein
MFCSVVALSIEELRSRFGSRISQANAQGDTARAPVLRLGWSELDEVLPDGGFPCGVVELAAPCALGGGVAIALSAVRAAHRNAGAWCAWIDPEGTLYAPGVALGGVDLTRLFVVRPPRSELARIAVKVASSGAFDVIIIDVDPIPGAHAAVPQRRSGKKAWSGEVFVRKLALAAQKEGATIVLLTDACVPRAMPWPVALRLELSRNREAFAVHVAKERYGRVGLVKTVPMKSRPSCWSDAVLETG